MSPPGPVPSWAEVLDDFGRCLAAQESLVATGRHDQVVAFQPPDGLGPLPAHLELQARALLTRSEGLEQAVRTELDGSRRRAALLRRLQPTTGTSPAYTEVLA